MDTLQKNFGSENDSADVTRTLRFICETGTDEHSTHAHEQELAAAVHDTALTDFYQPFMMVDYAQPGGSFH